MADNKTIGLRLKALRVSKGMTQNELSQKLNISCSAIAMYELGERIPRDELKSKISSFFDCSVESIFFTL